MECWGGGGVVGGGPHPAALGFTSGAPSDRHTTRNRSPRGGQGAATTSAATWGFSTRGSLHYPLDRNRVSGLYGPWKLPPPTQLYGDATTIMQ